MEPGTDILEGQKDSIMKLMQDREFVEKISRIDDISKLVKCFEEKGINMSEHDAERILEEKEKNRGKFNNLSESELSDIVGGYRNPPQQVTQVIVQNNPQPVVVVEKRHHRSHCEERGKPLTAVGGVAVGGVLSVIGIVLAAVSAYKWKKYGADHEL